MIKCSTSDVSQISNDFKEIYCTPEMRSDVHGHKNVQFSVWKCFHYRNEISIDFFNKSTQGFIR